MIDNNRLSPILGDPSNDKELEIKIEKFCPPKEKSFRRRSSFLAEARRSIGNALTGDSCNNPQLRREDQGRKEIEYTASLKNEEKKWCDIIKKRKHEYQETDRRYTEYRKNRQVMNEEECWSYLDEEEKQYLMNLPNFSSIVRKSNQLVKTQSVLESQRQTNKLILMKILEKINQDLEATKEKIREHSRKMPI